MDTAAPPNTTNPSDSAKSPSGLMIASSILLIPGLVITGMLIAFEIIFYSENPVFFEEEVVVDCFIAAILILLEIYYILSVLLTKLRKIPYKPQKMKNLAMLMLIINCLLFVCCYVSRRFFQGWTQPGYFTIADILIITSAPDILIKILALLGASAVLRK